MTALGHNSDRVASTKDKVLRRYRPGCTRSDASHMQSTRLASGLQAGVAMSVEAWVGSSAGLLSNWQRAGPKSLASFRRGSIPVRMPWDISPSGSGAPKMVQRRYRGVRLLRAKRCCEMRSARRAKSQHAGLARSEQVWLLRLGSLLCGVAAQQAEGKTSNPDSGVLGSTVQSLSLIHI